MIEKEQLTRKSERRNDYRQALYPMPLPSSDIRVPDGGNSTETGAKSNVAIQI